MAPSFMGDPDGCRSGLQLSKTLSSTTFRSRGRHRSSYSASSIRSRTPQKPPWLSHRVLGYQRVGWDALRQRQRYAPTLDKGSTALTFSLGLMRYAVGGAKLSGHHKASAGSERVSRFRPGAFLARYRDLRHNTVKKRMAGARPAMLPPFPAARRRVR